MRADVLAALAQAICDAIDEAQAVVHGAGKVGVVGCVACGWYYETRKPHYGPLKEHGDTARRAVEILAKETRCR